MDYLALCISLLVGILIGTFVGIFIGIGRIKRSIKEQSVGYLRIDRSEPDEPARQFLELQGATIESISRKNFIMLKVVNKNYLSRD